MFSQRLLERAGALVARFSALGLTLATAESCTGGLLAGLLSEIPGASNVLDRGYVTYSNAAKIAMLGVPDALLQAHGAVSAATARAMAEGALAASGCAAAIAITGIAGPGGGSPAKPIGLVYFHLAGPGRASPLERRFGDLSRAAIRQAALASALDLLETI